MKTLERHTLTLRLDDRCRALARVLALVEGRGLIVGELRFTPATQTRRYAVATVQISGDAHRLETVISRIEALPSVQHAQIAADLAA